jgi:tight adherence protein B
MESLAGRVQLPELGLLSTLLSVHRQTGGGLADSLDRLSVLLRERIQFRRQMAAASSGGRLSAMLIAPAAPLVFATLLVLSPEHVEVFFTTGLGRLFFILGIVLNLVGIVWILTLIRMPR